MSENDREIYEFGEFRLNVAEHFLVHSGGERVPISEKAFETLCILVRNAGHLVNKNELFNQVWADSFVEENNLNKCIHAIRRALGEKPGGQQFIETIKKHGFRFVAEVRRVPPEETTDFVHRENGFQLKTRHGSSAKFLRLPEQSGMQKIGAVIAPADWRREANGNEAAERILPSTRPEESTAQIIEPELTPANSDGEIKHLPKYRLAAFALAIFFITSIGLGYHFSGSKKVSSADGKKSIAVLPLKPINAANRDEIYEVGITESLIMKLGAMKGFIVRPLGATRKYSDIEQDPILAGREQKTDYVLAANYQITGGKIRITAQLYNVESGQIEETYKSEKDANDIFALQDQIAGDIGNLLKTRFSTTTGDSMAKRGTTNEEAYRLYLQGANLTARRTGADANKAIEYFEQAIRLDPNYARAFSGMAFAYRASGTLGGGFPREQFEQAQKNVARALELDPNLAEAYIVRGDLKHFTEWNAAEAEKDLLRAIELQPNNDQAHTIYADVLLGTGRSDQAHVEIETALEINPASLSNQRNRGRFFYSTRRYDEAIVHLKRVIEVDKSFRTAYDWLWFAYAMKGDEAGAFECFLNDKKLKNPEHAKDYQNAYENGGWNAVLRKSVEFEKLDEGKPSGSYYRLARLYSLLNEKELAFEYLNKALEKRHSQMVMLKIEPAFDLLRGDPRFDELVGRVGLK